MKTYPIILFVFFLISCSPKVLCFGDLHPTTTTLDTYYSPGDIKREYKVIGHLKGYDGLVSQPLEEIKLEIIKSAKRIEASGILFLLSESHYTDTTLYPIHADLLIIQKID